MIAEFGLAGAYPNVRHSVKVDRLIPYRTDLKDDDPPGWVIDDARLESRIGMQARREPWQQVLIALRFGAALLHGITYSLRDCKKTGSFVD